MKMVTLSAALIVVATPLGAEAQASASGGDSDHDAVVALPGSIDWRAGPASLPPGAEVAVLDGDPATPGPFTMRLRFPASYRIPPHFHSTAERVTVVSGSFWIGMGREFDRSLATRLPPGGYAAMDPGLAHFAWTTEPTVVQLNSDGPWSLTYVEAADDPRGTDGR